LRDQVVLTVYARPKFENRGPGRKSKERERFTYWVLRSFVVCWCSVVAIVARLGGDRATGRIYIEDMVRCGGCEY
jgi:hypothetical protein